MTILAYMTSPTVVINNNNINVVSDSNTDSSEEDFQNDDKTFFYDDVDTQVKATPQTTINAKVVQAMKNAPSFIQQ